LFAFFIGCSSTPPESSDKAASREVSRAKITMFYPATPVVRPGANVTVCYGVENAVSLTLDPAVEELTPSLNRCFEAPVPRETEFKLTARGAGGDEVMASFTVGVSKDAGGPTRAERTTTGPVIASFTAEPSQIASGAPPVKLCYQAANAQSVTVQPKVADLGGAMMGCFYAPTEKTTTYVLTAHGANGSQDVKRVTVTVR
jgi:hypothetical protein